MQFEDVEYLFEGHVNIGGILSGSARVESTFFSTLGVPFKSRSGMVNHILMNFLPLFFLPMMHNYFIMLAKEETANKLTKTK